MMESKTNTLKIYRVIKAPVERVYKAFLDPEAKVKWLPPHGFTGKMIHSDIREGGSYKMSFTNFSTGKSHSFGGKYIKLVPNEFIQYHDQFDDPNLPGEMDVCIYFKKVLAGTEIQVVQAGIPEVIPLEFCHLGWQESLQLLTLLVEPEIPDGA